MSNLQNLRTANLIAIVERYLLDIRLRNFSPRTVESNTLTLRSFARWCDDLGITRAREITDEVLSGYRRYIFHYINPASGKPLKFSSQAYRLTTVRTFCRWMVKSKITDTDPTLNMEIPQVTKRRIAEVLTIDEVHALLAAPDVSQLLGIRNRAILETFFSTAIRASELRNLQLADIHASRGVVHVRHGKGDKDRLVPIGKQATEWIEKYRIDVRPALANNHSGTCLFIGQRGKRLSREMLALIVRQCMKDADIKKIGACHILRHTAASLMLEAGADLRSLQLYLGHEKLDTTQIYTHMTIGRLKDVHGRTHPTGDERLENRDEGPPKK